MKKCERCGNPFTLEDSKARFLDHLRYLGWEDEFDEYYNKNLCEFCVCDAFDEAKDNLERMEEENDLYLLEHGNE
jgi:hypothetical protein